MLFAGHKKTPERGFGFQLAPSDSEVKLQLFPPNGWAFDRRSAPYLPVRPGRNLRVEFLISFNFTRYLLYQFIHFASIERPTGFGDELLNDPGEYGALPNQTNNGLLGIGELLVLRCSHGSDYI